MVAALQAIALGTLVLGVVEAISKLDVAVTATPSFDNFVKQYGRMYHPGQPEFAERASIYARHVAEAALQNSHAGRLWNAGVNSHWDRTDTELSLITNDGVVPVGSAGLSKASLATPPLRFHAQVRNATITEHRTISVRTANRTATVSHALPREKSWAHLHAWTTQPVKDQGNCGSCWAIAASTLLQAHSEIYSQTPRTFSVQELVSCVPNPNECGGTGGCKGATVGLALEWALRNGLDQAHEQAYDAGWMGKAGVCTRSTNPNIESSASFLSSSPVSKSSKGLSSFGSPVKRDPGGPGFGMQSWQKLPENKYEPLMRALVELGPVAVSIASGEWHNYRNGIFDGCSTSVIIGHAVVLLAYGEEGDTKFWTIRNSWGDDWGEAGKMRLLRRDDDEANWCGTNYSPEVGSGCKGGPKTVNVCGMCGILYNPSVPHFSRSATQRLQDLKARVHSKLSGA